MECRSSGVEGYGVVCGGTLTQGEIYFYGGQEGLPSLATILM